MSASAGAYEPCPERRAPRRMSVGRPGECLDHPPQSCGHCRRYGGSMAAKSSTKRHRDISVSATRPHDPSLGLREPMRKVLSVNIAAYSYKSATDAHPRASTSAQRFSSRK